MRVVPGSVYAEPRVGEGGAFDVWFATRPDGSALAASFRDGAQRCWTTVHHPDVVELVERAVAVRRLGCVGWEPSE